MSVGYRMTSIQKSRHFFAAWGDTSVKDKFNIFLVLIFLLNYDDLIKQHFKERQHSTISTILPKNTINWAFLAYKNESFCVYHFWIYIDFEDWIQEKLLKRVVEHQIFGKLLCLFSQNWIEQMFPDKQILKSEIINLESLI